jgi:hypothetical protein
MIRQFFFGHVRFSLLLQQFKQLLQKQLDGFLQPVDVDRKVVSGQNRIESRGRLVAQQNVLHHFETSHLSVCVLKKKFEK